jgi:hypothetical protein
MGRALGDILPLAVAAALRPATIVAIILLLTTPNARSNGFAFAVGFLLGLAALATALLVIASLTGASDSGAPALWVSVLKLVLGGVCTLVALQIWARRPRRGEQLALPEWLDRVDRLTAHEVFGLGGLAAVANGKNLMLTGAGAMYIAATGIPVVEQAVALAVFVLIAGLCVLAPLGIYLVGGAWAARTLDGLRAWMIEYSPAIIATLFLLIGAVLIGDGISDLA